MSLASVILYILRDSEKAIGENQNRHREPVFRSWLPNFMPRFHREFNAGLLSNVL